MGSMSTKIGLHPSQIKTFVVAQYENGVVSTFPFKSKPFMASCNAIVPFETKMKFSTSRNSPSLCSNSLTKGPSLVK